jgi:hypothetical protein
LRENYRKLLADPCLGSWLPVYYGLQRSNTELSFPEFREFISLIHQNDVAQVGDWQALSDILCFHYSDAARWHAQVKIADSYGELQDENQDDQADELFQTLYDSFAKKLTHWSQRLPCGETICHCSPEERHLIETMDRPRYRTSFWMTADGWMHRQNRYMAGHTICPLFDVSMGHLHNFARSDLAVRDGVYSSEEQQQADDLAREIETYVTSVCSDLFARGFNPYLRLGNYGIIDLYLRTEDPYPKEIHFRSGDSMISDCTNIRNLTDPTIVIVTEPSFSTQWREENQERFINNDRTTPYGLQLEMRQKIWWCLQNDLVRHPVKANDGTGWAELLI